MRADTQSVTIEIDARSLFGFLADPENLPRWAVGFCRAIRREADRWIAQTQQGEVEIRYVTDAADGVIDFHISVEPGVELVARSRVVPNGEHAEYIFTQFQARGMPDHVFEGQIAALKEELLVLGSLIRARAVCPA